MLDVLIRGGTVIDGTGRPGRRADVAIARDRIEAIDLLPGATAARVIDAAGHAVAPGFIDMHSHADFVLPGLPTADSKVHQGFTLEVVGNCGASPAPLTPARRQDIIDATGLAVPALRVGLDDVPELPRRADPPASADQRRARWWATGRSASWSWARTTRARPPTSAERWPTEVRRAVDEGAIGVSTGLIYPPACSRTPTRSSTWPGPPARAEASTRATSGARATRSCRRSPRRSRSGAERRPVQISHLKAAGRTNWPKMAEAIELIEAARPKAST